MPHGGGGEVIIIGQSPFSAVHKRGMYLDAICRLLRINCGTFDLDWRHSGRVFALSRPSIVNMVPEAVDSVSGRKPEA